jgi:hypothetical protein
MPHDHRLILLGCLALVGGCGSGSYSSTLGSAPVVSGTGTTTTTGATAPPGFNTPAPAVGTHDVVIATPSTANVAVTVGASQTVSVTFASSDGQPMSAFSISSVLGALPAGWSGPANFVCASLSTGSGCVLNLVYAPTAVDSGALTVGYVVIDNSGIPRTDGSTTIAYAATAHDNVVGLTSPTGEVDAVAGAGPASVLIDFVTDDGNPATNFSVSTNLGSLPAGWTSTAPGLTCAIVSTGNGCELVLAYAAAAAGSGLLAIDFSYADDSGAVKTGSVDLPYRSTSTNDVVATASPAGEVLAVQKTGAQAVPVTFTTDDGRPASDLTVSSNLSALPAGWTSTSHQFACASVSTGNGCQLSLKYAPTALGSGTLALSYAYTDAAGVAKNGLLDIAYAATTDDNVLATAAPVGQVNAVVGLGSQSVGVVFSTDDGRPATALVLSSNLALLPSGWTSPAPSFACPGIDIDAVCSLALTYTPTAAANGTLDLGYAYRNNAGDPKTGTVNIAYRATTDDTVVGTPSASAVSVAAGGSANPTVTFTTDDGNPASLLTVITAASSLPPGWSITSSNFSCATVSVGNGCVLALRYAPTAVAAGTLTLGFSYTNDAQLLKAGTVTIGYADTGP